MDEIQTSGFQMGSTRVQDYAKSGMTVLTENDEDQEEK